jgi:hypothetical protein
MGTLQLPPGMTAARFAELQRQAFSGSKKGNGENENGNENGGDTTHLTAGQMATMAVRHPSMAGTTFAAWLQRRQQAQAGTGGTDDIAHAMKFLKSTYKPSNLVKESQKDTKDEAFAAQGRLVAALGNTTHEALKTALINYINYRKAYGIVGQLSRASVPQMNGLLKAFLVSFFNYLICNQKKQIEKLELMTTAANKRLFGPQYNVNSEEETETTSWLVWKSKEKIEFPLTVLTRINAILAAEKEQYANLPMVAGVHTNPPSVEIEDRRTGEMRPLTDDEINALYIRAHEQVVGSGKGAGPRLNYREGISGFNYTGKESGKSTVQTKFDVQKTLAKVGEGERFELSKTVENVSRQVKSSLLYDALVADINTVGDALVDFAQTRYGVELRSAPSSSSTALLPASSTTTFTSRGPIVALPPPGRRSWNSRTTPLNNRGLAQLRQQQEAAKTLAQMSSSSGVVAVLSSNTSLQEEVLAKIKPKTSSSVELDLLRTLISGVLNATTLRDTTGLAVVVMGMIDGAYRAKDKDEPPMKTGYFKYEDIKQAYLDLHAFYKGAKGGARRQKNKTQKRKQKQSRNSCWPKSRKQNKTRKH